MAGVVPQGDGGTGEGVFVTEGAQAGGGQNPVIRAQYGGSEPADTFDEMFFSVMPIP